MATIVESTNRYSPGTVVFDGSERRGEAVTIINNARRHAAARFAADNTHKPMFRPLEFPALATFSYSKWKMPKWSGPKPGDGTVVHDASTARGVAACRLVGAEFWAKSDRGYWAVRSGQYVQVTASTLHDSTVRVVAHTIPDGGILAEVTVPSLDTTVPFGADQLALV